eukprot:CAMPEP_0180786562 /NCGR_PEP_ID=MMETSP1038_2-20121128/50868_1 /TAXON_ID=632150 /ORGANISM="Azadinium spinosum, Strain 3D9" /LENGTH=44 /DNA_ID= /DNA_START= /DNA_END= /DNA_ORIENTATION=
MGSRTKSGSSSSSAPKAKTPAVSTPGSASRTCQPAASSSARLRA